MLTYLPRIRSTFAKTTVHPRAQLFHSQSFFQQSFRNQQRNRQQYKTFSQTKNIFQKWAASPYFYHQIGGFGAATGTFYVYNLEQVPISGRRRFNVISNEREKELGEGVGKSVIEQYRNRILPPNDKRVQLVQRILARLMPESGISNKENWAVYVIDSPEVNAFVTPDNNVFVFTGILPICKNEDGIAAVLGHEIAHNFAHHTAEKASRAFVLMLTAGFLELCMTLSGFYGFGGLVNQLLTVTLSLPNGRAQESEADYIGLLMMARACYNPEEAVRLWARMREYEKKQGGSVPEFMSTHPSSENRGKKLDGWMNEASDRQLESGCHSTMAYSNAFRNSGALGHWS